MMATALPCLQAILGILVFLGVGLLLSEAPRNVRWRPVVMSLLAQASLVVLTLKVPWVRSFFLVLSDGIGQIKAATLAGTSFAFGYVGGAPLPFEIIPGGNSFVFAAQALPMVMVVSALAMLLFHWRILPWVVKTFSWFLSRALGIGGALGVCAAAKVFLGQTEAPLLIRPYLSRLTRSELFSVMTLGMATTSASVMVIYATILEKTLAHPISHILTASIISVPAAIGISRIMVPQTEADTQGDLVAPYRFSSATEAISVGATDGMKLFINIVAMLVVMLALVFLADGVLSALPVSWLGLQPLRLARLLGLLMSPIAWLMGIPAAEAQIAGNLIGTKVALNEVMAFIELSRLPDLALCGSSRLIMLYALCGFANFSSIAVQIGGLGTMAPERRSEIIDLGMRSLVAGTMASCMSGTMVGLLFRIL